MPSRDVGGVAANCRVRQSARWHARREFELLKLVAHEGSEETRELFLRLRLQKHHTPPEAKQAAGRRAKPAPARTQTVPEQKTAAQLARSERNRERLRQKHLARVAKVLPRLQAWLRRAKASLEQRMEPHTAPAPPGTPPAVAVPESGTAPTPLRAYEPSPCISGDRYHSITKMAEYRDKSFEELRWEHYSKGNILEAQPPAEPPAAAQPAPPSQLPSPALVAAARASLDASELQDSRGSKRDALARTPPSASAPERPPPPADARKRPASRGGRQLEAALAHAAPAAAPDVQPATAETYAAIALAAAANPRPRPSA